MLQTAGEQIARMFVQILIGMVIGGMIALADYTTPRQLGTLTGALAGNNMDNPIAFLCGAIQAASRLGGEQAGKLCVQYLAPIIKNRQYNFPPLGEDLFVGAQARPNEVTYSEGWMRPDFVPPTANTPPPAQPPAPGPPPAPPPGAVATDPAAGLSGMMMPPGGGS